MGKSYWGKWEACPDNSFDIQYDGTTTKSCLYFVLNNSNTITVKKEPNVTYFKNVNVDDSAMGSWYEHKK